MVAYNSGTNVLISTMNYKNLNYEIETFELEQWYEL